MLRAPVRVQESGAGGQMVLRDWQQAAPQALLKDFVPPFQE
jgi:hypothetical protein